MNTTTMPDPKDAAPQQGSMVDQLPPAPGAASTPDDLPSSIPPLGPRAELLVAGPRDEARLIHYLEETVGREEADNAALGREYDGARKHSRLEWLIRRAQELRVSNHLMRQAIATKRTAA